MSRTQIGIFVLALFFLVALPVPGQIPSASIAGTITTAAGNALPDASVTILNQDTNVSLEVRSNGSGDYTASYLRAGKYTILVKKDGFQPYRRTDVRLDAAQRIRVDAKLSADAARSDQG